MRSKLSRRSSSAREASGDGRSPAASIPASTKASTGLRAQRASRVEGGVLARGRDVGPVRLPLRALPRSSAAASPPARAAAARARSSRAACGSPRRGGGRGRSRRCDRARPPPPARCPRRACPSPPPRGRAAGRPCGCCRRGRGRGSSSRPGSGARRGCSGGGSRRAGATARGAWSVASRASATATVTPSGQGAPASIQRRSVSICAGASGSASCGMRCFGSGFVTRAISRLAAGSPGTTIAPDSPPRRKYAAVSRRSEALLSPLPWQRTQDAARIGCTSRTKSGAALSARGGAVRRTGAAPGSTRPKRRPAARSTGPPVSAVSSRGPRF